MPRPEPARARWTTRLPAAAVAALLLAAGTACADDGEATGAEIEGITRAEPLQVGDVTVPEVAPGQADRDFAFRADPGGLLVVYFGYTYCPDLCPATLADVRLALSQLGADAERVEVAFLTVDPQRDTPEVLARYLGSFVDGGHALRAEDPEVLRAAEAAFGASSTLTYDDDGNVVDVAHSTLTYAVDADGTVLVEWPFGTEPGVLAADLRVLLERIDPPAAPT